MVYEFDDSPKLLKRVLRETSGYFRDYARIWEKYLRRKAKTKDLSLLEFSTSRISRSSVEVENNTLAEIIPEYEVVCGSVLIKFPGVYMYAEKCDSLSPYSLKEALNSILSNTLETIAENFGLIPLKEIRPVTLEELDVISKPFHHESKTCKSFELPDSKELRNLVKCLMSEILSIDKRMEVSLRLESVKEEIYRISNLSQAVSFRAKAYSSLEILLKRKHPRFGHFLYGKGWATLGGLSMLESELDRIREEASECARELKGYVKKVKGVKLPSPAEDVKLIAHPEVTHLFLHESFGHGCEAINFIPAVTVAGLFKSRRLPSSVNLRENLGKKVLRHEQVCSGIVLKDDPTFERLPDYPGFVNAASYEVDERGVRPRRDGTPLIEEGVLKEALTDVISASVLHRMGILERAMLTGNERCSGMGYVPCSRMSTLRLDVGKADLLSYDEMLGYECDRKFELKGEIRGGISIEDIVGESQVGLVYEVKDGERTPVCWPADSRLKLVFTYTDISRKLLHFGKLNDQSCPARSVMGFCDHPISGTLTHTGYLPCSLLENIQLAVRE
jgi:predicted Zn-dependent protease